LVKEIGIVFSSVLAVSSRSVALPEAFAKRFGGERLPTGSQE
jgi:hypothetical protein